MILASLRRSLLAKAQAWSKQSGVALPAVLALNPPPPHIKADVSLP